MATLPLDARSGAARRLPGGLERCGSPVRNPVLCEALGWPEAQYEAVKTELAARKIVVRGRGRSDTVSLVGGEPGVGSRQKAFQLVEADKKLVRFYLPLRPTDPELPVWSVIRLHAERIGEGVTSQLRAIARENPLLQGIIDRVDFNATTHGQRDLDADWLSNLIEAISSQRLGLMDPRSRR